MTHSDNIRVCITGMGVITCNAHSQSELLDALRSGRSGIKRVERLNTVHREWQLGEIDDIADSDDCPRAFAMARQAFSEAIRQAGLEGKILLRIAIVNGTTVGGMDLTERSLDAMLTSSEQSCKMIKWHPCGAMAEWLSEQFAIECETYTISTACSSAANAMAFAADLVRTDRADVVIAGGAESLTKFHTNGFNSLMVLDAERCRPFDRDRAGINLAEGSAFLVLESERSALRRGVSPLALLSGYGNACDAYHPTATSPDGEGAYLAMHKALTMAGLNASDIDYINAHGTGTADNDLSESTALQRLFADCPEIVPVSSTKAFTGHTTSASGAIESVICLLAMLHRFIPQNLGFTFPMEGGVVPSAGAENVTLHNVMCNSFGFGGNDTSLIFSEYNSGQLAEQHSATPKNEPIVLSEYSLRYGEEFNLSQYFPVLKTRRMCQSMKMAMYVAMTALESAGVNASEVDAIIFTTRDGMLDNSEKLLCQIEQSDEQNISPTLFMQSTHNTMAGQFAILTRNHGYNTTFTPTRYTLDAALLDARMQIELGRIRTALIVECEECTEQMRRLLRDASLPMPESDIYCRALVVSAKL